MKKITAITFILLIQCTVFSQSGWFTQFQTTGGLRAVQFINNNTGFIGGNSNSAYTYKTTNGGINWTLINNLRGIWDLYFLNENTGYVGGPQGYIMKTTNSGVNWTETNISAPYQIFKIHFLNLLTGFTSGENGKVVKTTNGGDNWITYTAGGNYPLWGLWFLNPDTGFVANDQGYIYRTFNGGVNWSQVFYLANFSVQSLTFINNNTGFAVGVGSNLLRTTNVGYNWTAINIPNGDYKDIFFRTGGTGFIAGYDYNASSGRIMKSTNYGDNWFITPVPVNDDYKSIYFPSQDTGYVVLGNGYQLKTISGGVGITKISTEIPESFVLEQNYPNPFNPSTNIRFAITAKAKSEKSKIIIFDVMGQEIETLINDYLQPGTYEVDWDGTNYSSGVYYYKLTSGEFIQTKKMILLK